MREILTQLNEIIKYSINR